MKENPFLLVSALITGFALPASGATAPVIEVVSAPYEAHAHVFGDSSGIELSADAQWALFSSSGNGLVTNDNNGLSIDVFLKNLQTGATTLISRGINEGGNGNSIGTAISTNGQFVLFESDADNLVPDDVNASSDVFLYDRTTGGISPISLAEGGSTAVAISSDARFIVFESSAPLSPLDTNMFTDLYLFDRETGTSELVTLNAKNTAASSNGYNDSSLGIFESAVSENGHYVAYLSAAADTVIPGPVSTTTILAPQLYLRDMTSHTNVYVTKGSNGSASAFVTAPVLSKDGQLLAFLSDSLTNTAGVDRTILYIYKTSTSERIPVQYATDFSMSADGLWIAYEDMQQVFLYDVSAGSTRLISANTNGTAASGYSSGPLISDDGSIVLFTSNSTNLAGISAASGATSELYRYDRNSGSLALLTGNRTGPDTGAFDIVFSALSGDGSTAGFMSYAANLTTNDDKNMNDVFVVPTSGSGTISLVSAPEPTATSVTASDGSSLYSGGISADGRYILFTSDAPDLVPNDDNGAPDVFLRDSRTGTNRLVSLSADGIHPLGNGGSLAQLGNSPWNNSCLSLNGALAVFASSITNAAGALQRVCFVYDVTAGTNAIASLLPDGNVTAISTAALSADGHYLAFTSGDLSLNSVYLRDLKNGITRAIPSGSSHPLIATISPNGRYITLADRSVILDSESQTEMRVLNVFDHGSLRNDAILTSGKGGRSLAIYSLTLNTNTDLIGDARYATLSLDASTVAYNSSQETNAEIYVYDTATKTNETLTVNGTNVLLRIRGNPVISADNRFLAVVSKETPLPDGSGYEFGAIYVYDRLLKTLVLVSHSLTGDPGDFGSNLPMISADGQVVAFQSSATDLVLNDRNFAADIFMARLPITDSNGNGIEDGWEFASFGNTNADPGADPDADGMTNLEEYRAGTNPSDPQSSLALQVISTSAQEENVLTLQWTGALGKSYQVQSVSTLGGSWQNLTNPMIATMQNQAFSVRAPIDGQAQHFYRVLAAE